MKKVFIFLLLTAISVKAGAQSMLKVSLTDRTIINISVDGRYFEKQGTSVTVGDMPEGRHYLKIYVAMPNRRGRMKETVVYEGQIQTYTGSVSLFTFNMSSGQYNIEEQSINANTNNLPPENNQNTGYPANNGNNSTPDNSTYQGNNQDNTGNNSSGTAVASPVSPESVPTLSDNKVSKLKTKIAAKPTDTQKIAALKDGLKDEQFTTDQVSDMMGWLIFESSKVTFAEWAYSHTVDKENFSSLENKFSYKNSQDDLEKFIRDQK